MFPTLCEDACVWDASGTPVRYLTQHKPGHFLACFGGKVLDKYFLFVDERGNLSPKDTSKEPFVLLGVSLKESDIEELSNDMYMFKKKLRPNLDPLEWELKAATGDKELKMSLEELRNMWEQFAELLTNLKVRFYTYVVFAVKDKLKNLPKNNDIEWNSKKFKHAFLRVNFYQLLLAFVSLEPVFRFPYDDLESMRNFSFRIVYDNLDDHVIKNWVRDIHNYSIETINTDYGMNLTGEIAFLGFEKGNSQCLVLQFVDMVIYFLSRFVIGKDVLGLNDTLESHLKYYDTILFYIGHSFIKNVHLGKTPATGSCILLSENDDFNFAVRLGNQMLKVSHGESNWMQMDL